MGETAQKPHTKVDCDHLLRRAYLKRPIPIGFDKTISQPMMVAVMTDLLELKPDDVVGLCGRLCPP